MGNFIPAILGIIISALTIMRKTLDIITKWDPMNFMSHAPDDEYSDEAEKIDELLERTTDIDELARGIELVFKSMFGSDFNKSIDECREIAKKLVE